MAEPARYKSIKSLVFAYVRETNGDVDYEELTRRVREFSPDSAWKKSHWAYYKTQIANGRYSHEFPDEIRAKFARGRPLLRKEDRADAEAAPESTAETNSSSAPRRPRLKRPSGIVYPNLLDDPAHMGLAMTLASVAHHVHPAVVAKIQRLNADHGDELRAMLPPEIDADEYLYPGSACVFPGVRRAVGIFGQQQIDEINKYNPKNGAIVDRNVWPRNLWSFLAMGQPYNHPGWKQSKLDHFELAHIFGHKPEERRLEAKAFENFDASVRPWGLFTCASNTVLLPKGLAKPTDQLRTLRVVFFKRAIDLYGDGILPGASGLRDDHVPAWYAELDWNNPILPEDWEAKIERLHEYRIKRLSAIFGRPV